ncbi:MAG TPA: phosphoenolpyruvate carboxylase [Candidatus Saccharimonadales bacterium]|nr:phosphoenolpyruvate carboxylase [Candidatus Saccharimonadales bacterium]
MRKIPATMATQHPDNASAPFWDKQKDPFISVYKEIDEAVICLDELGASEFMWDWEGKHADAAVIDKLFSEYFDYFSKNQLHRDKFLTFRIPNIWEEKGYSLLLAMTVILSSEDFARDLKFDKRPLFEIILPMTENANQLMKMHTLFEKLADFKSKEFTTEDADNQNQIELIPLVESVKSQQSVGKLLREYVGKYKKRYGNNPEYIRPFFARSDPALMSGMLATVLANKIAISQVYGFAEKTGIPVFPLSGAGSLPFRGGLSPDAVDDYMREYPGLRTVTVQSSFRYDNPLSQVKAAITRLEEKLPKIPPVIYSPDVEKKLIAIGKISEKYYQKTLAGIAPDMKDVFASVPKRRERRQHIGLLAYGRKVGEQKMPRAITFTAGFYSIGVPPELIGTGRALKKLSEEDRQTVFEHYKLLKSDMEKAGRYLNLDNLERLAAANPAWQDIKKDIKSVSEILGIELGTSTPAEKKHHNLTSEILDKKDNPGKALTNKITETAELRKSLG